MSTFTAIISVVLTTATAADIDLKLKDGTFVRGEVPNDKVFSIQTKYGVLKVPATDITSISFAWRNSAENTAKVEGAIAKLGSPDFREREKAAKVLSSLGTLAIKELMRGKKSSDAEIASRSAALLQHFSDTQLARVRPHDTIHTSQFAVSGELLDADLVVHSPSLGELKLPQHLLDTASLYRQQNRVSLELDASNEGWVPTGIRLREGQAFCLKAAGSVDLWPQTPGINLAGPAGLPGHQGKGGSPFLAGSLVGRVGPGKEFVVGTDCNGFADAEGTLVLRVIGSPWNNTSAGVYRVEAGLPD